MGEEDLAAVMGPPAAGAAEEAAEAPEEGEQEDPMALLAELESIVARLKTSLG